MSRARHGQSDQSRAALAELCQAYWRPLYQYARRRGYRPEDASDLAQGYFALLIEKDYLQAVRLREGRFRAFLLTSFRHFVSNSRNQAQALKRGGAKPIPSLDSLAFDERPAHDPRGTCTAEEIFEREWALTVLEHGLSRLREEAVDAGREVEFERLRHYLTGEHPRTPYLALASELQSTEAAVKMAVHRMRRRYGWLLRQEIARTVSDTAMVDAELRHLLGRVRPWEPLRSG